MVVQPSFQLQILLSGVGWKQAHGSPSHQNKHLQLRSVRGLLPLVKDGEVLQIVSRVPARSRGSSGSRQRGWFPVPPTEALCSSPPSPAAAVPCANPGRRPTRVHPRACRGDTGHHRAEHPSWLSPVPRQGFSPNPDLIFPRMSISAPASPTPKLISCHRDSIRLVPPGVGTRRIFTWNIQEQDSYKDGTSCPSVDVASHCRLPWQSSRILLANDPMVPILLGADCLSVDQPPPKSTLV